MPNRLPLLLLICCVLFLPTLALTPFYTRGEPREALVAQAMLDSGNWVLPRSSYNQAVPSKPPLMHWLIGALSSATGEVTPFTARLPSALSAILFTAVFFVFLRRRTSSEVAWLSALVLTTSVEWTRAAVSCRVDMVLSVCLGLGLLDVYRWYERRLTGVPLLAVLAFAGATLSKGPVALVLPAGIFGLFLLLRGVTWWRACYKTAAVIAPALILAGIWYAAAYSVDPQAFWDKVYAENIARFTSSMDDSPHEHSVFYLIGVFIVGLLPWSILLVTRAVQTMSTWRETIRWPQSDLALYSLVVVVEVFVFYAIPASKRSVYLLPCYPFVAFLIAGLLIKLGEASPIQRALRPLMTATLLIIAAVNLAGLPIFASTLSAREFSVKVRELAVGHRLVSYGYNHFQIAFYSKLPITEISDTSKIASTDLVLVAQAKLQEFKSQLPEVLEVVTVATSPNPIEKSGNTLLLVKLQSTSLE